MGNELSNSVVEHLHGLHGGACLLLIGCRNGNTIALEFDKLNRGIPESDLKRLLAEVNSVVRQLSLSEATPIVEKDCDVHIHPPRIAKGMKALGSVSTRKFTYYFSVENKFSFVESAIPITERYRKVRSAYTWPVSRKDTNAALQIATQWLGAIGIDAGALNRACQVEVSAWSPEGPNSPRFVPVYWVTWRETNSLAAFVELIVPTRTLYQLRIEKGKYIMRSPVVTDAEQQKWAN